MRSHERAEQNFFPFDVGGRRRGRLRVCLACAAPLSRPSPIEGEGVWIKHRLICRIPLLIAILTIFVANIASAQQLETLNVSYASVTGSRIPLWIARDAGLFEKYGLNVNLVVIAAGTAAIGALASGDVEILGAPGSTTMVSAARGLPVAIIGTFGPSAWKLAAHPSITSVEQLRGKTVGISRPGTTIEFATKRALTKLGFTPGKDIQILATGLAESNSDGLRKIKAGAVHINGVRVTEMLYPGTESELLLQVGKNWRRVKCN